MEECIDAGIKQFIFIISTRKKNIKKYFYNDALYKKILKKKKDKRILNEYKRLNALEK